jgi:hypothetical protein
VQKWILLASIVGIAGLFGGPAAHATTLQDLITQGMPMTSGDVTYTNFTATGNLPASDVTVNFTASGVQFTANWNTLTPGSDSSVISYTITPQSGYQLSQADLYFAGQVIVSHATATVNETLSDLTTGNDYKMSVFYDGLNSPNDDLRDSVVIDPTASSLQVTKSIQVATTGDNSFASLNFVENTYAQVAVAGGQPPAPEPATAGLLVLGVAGSLLRKRRRARG